MGVKGGFVPQFKVSDLIKQVTDKQKRVDDAIYMRLRRIGLQFVRDARIKADFTDRTGNLRSSIGFIITRNGRVMVQDFETAKRGTDKATGVAKGLMVAKEESLAYGWVLIVVAGMEYAAAVESKGYDVITGSSIEAKASLKQAIAELEQKINGR